MPADLEVIAEHTLRSNWRSGTRRDGTRYGTMPVAVEDRLGQHPLVRQLRFELEAHDCFSPPAPPP